MKVETRFIVNEKERTVVCIIETLNEMEAKLNKYDIPNNYFGDVIPDYWKYVGKAKCCPEDEWDENYGRKLAEYRAMKKRTDNVNNEIEKFIRGTVDNLNRLGTFGVMKEPKHPDEGSN